MKLVFVCTLFGTGTNVRTFDFPSPSAVQSWQLWNLSQEPYRRKCRLTFVFRDDAFMCLTSEPKRFLYEKIYQILKNKISQSSLQKLVSRKVQGLSLPAQTQELKKRV